MYWDQLQSGGNYDRWIIKSSRRAWWRRVINSTKMILASKSIHHHNLIEKVLSSKTQVKIYLKMADLKAISRTACKFDCS